MSKITVSFKPAGTSSREILRAVGHAAKVEENLGARGLRVLEDNERMVWEMEVSWLVGEMYVRGPELFELVALDGVDLSAFKDEPYIVLDDYSGHVGEGLRMMLSATLTHGDK